MIIRTFLTVCFPHPPSMGTLNILHLLKIINATSTRFYFLLRLPASPVGLGPKGGGNSPFWSTVFSSWASGHMRWVATTMSVVPAFVLSDNLRILKIPAFFLTLLGLSVQLFWSKVDHLTHFVPYLSPCNLSFMHSFNSVSSSELVSSHLDLLSWITIPACIIASSIRPCTNGWIIYQGLYPSQRNASNCDYFCRFAQVAHLSLSAQFDSL